MISPLSPRPGSTEEPAKRIEYPHGYDMSAHDMALYREWAKEDLDNGIFLVGSGVDDLALRKRAIGHAERVLKFYEACDAQRAEIAELRAENDDLRAWGANPPRMEGVND